ncbi:histidinol-phosphatase [Oxobacter pfennigii]|uniref:Histidinol-phosphatase n=1 Tax=Oxobacter pfennigii TaxID=36849 RepID=A0A0P8WMS4_9CLOT|nr:histidinol-phosphatase HisJ [Oxobacter pfennigii]KPU43820.1 histidinol-phosphatase [Oxobacter pfennigii]
MGYSNFHTHCIFCDGKGEPESFVQEAVKQGFDALGFSSHSPLSFNSWTMKEERIEEYLNTIENLRVKYKDDIQVYKGLEIDYIPGIYGPRSTRFENLNLDYNIGSIHTIKDEKTGEYPNIDGSSDEFERMLNGMFGGSMEKMARKYYGLVRDMVEIHAPDIVGHLDLLKKNNRGGKYFTEEESWYKEEIAKTLFVISKYRSIVEVNTGGMSRNYIDTFYPSPWILEECREMDIPVVLSADAHEPANISAFFNETAAFLKDIGYAKQRVLYNGKWADVGLE